MRSLAASFVLLLAVIRSGVAEAACAIFDPAPTVAVPTQRVGQTFSFTATDDCTDLTLTFKRGYSAHPTRTGTAIGTDAHRYAVSLSGEDLNRELHSDPFLSWTITGRSPGAGLIRVTTTNEVDVDHDGWARSDGDRSVCDYDASRNPGIDDLVGNGIDDDCDGLVDNTRFEDPVAEISGPSYYPTAIGDLDADGIADLALAFDQRYGQVYVVYGPTHGSLVASDSTELLTTTSDYIGSSVSIGDANGDGIDDLATGRHLYERGGRTYLLLGPVTADRSVADADAFFDADSSGNDVDIVPDFDGDGMGDVVAGAVAVDRWAGAVYVASGDSSGTIALDTSATYTFVGSETNNALGLYNFGIGDATGDGIADLALTANGISTVYLVEGGTPAGAYDVASTAWAALTGLSSEFGQGLASGDYDGDGARDIIVGDRYAEIADLSYPPGQAYAFLGPLSGTTSAADADATWTGVDNFDYVGEDVATADVDGDGSLDVLIGAPGAESSYGAVYLQLGFASGSVSVSTLPTFAPGTALGNPGEAGAFVNAIPDWEGDGGAEVAISSGRGDGIVVYESGALF